MGWLYARKTQHAQLLVVLDGFGVCLGVQRLYDNAPHGLDGRRIDCTESEIARIKHDQEAALMGKGRLVNEYGCIREALLLSIVCWGLLAALFASVL
jgi:hypothetical protein